MLHLQRPMLSPNDVNSAAFKTLSQQLEAFSGRGDRPADVVTIDPKYAREKFKALPAAVKDAVMWNIDGKAFHEIDPLLGAMILAHFKENAAGTDDAYVEKMKECIFKVKLPPVSGVGGHMVRPGALKLLSDMASVIMPLATVSEPYIEMAISETELNPQGKEVARTAEFSIPASIKIHDEEYVFDHDLGEKMLLGSSLSSVILRAKRKSNGEDVVVKIVADDGDERARHFFLEYLGELRHSGDTEMVQVYSAGRYSRIIPSEARKSLFAPRKVSGTKRQTYYFIVQERCERSLEDDVAMRQKANDQEGLSEQEIYTEEEKWEIAWQMVKMLEALHKKGLVHNDLAPKNLLLKGRRLKLNDFGVVVGLSPDEHELIDESFRGTPYFASNAAMRGRYNWSSDVISFVMVLSCLWPGVFDLRQSTVTKQKLKMTWANSRSGSDEGVENPVIDAMLEIQRGVTEAVNLRAFRLQDSEDYLARFIILPILRMNMAEADPSMDAPAAPQNVKELKALMEVVWRMRGVKRMIGKGNTDLAERQVRELAEQYGTEGWFGIVSEEFAGFAEALGIPYEFSQNEADPGLESSGESPRSEVRGSLGPIQEFFTPLAEKVILAPQGFIESFYESLGQGAPAGRWEGALTYSRVLDLLSVRTDKRSRIIHDRMIKAENSGLIQTGLSEISEQGAVLLPEEVLLASADNAVRGTAVAAAFCTIKMLQPDQRLLLAILTAPFNPKFPIGGFYRYGYVAGILMRHLSALRSYGPEEGRAFYSDLVWLSFAFPYDMHEDDWFKLGQFMRQFYSEGGVGAGQSLAALLEPGMKDRFSPELWDLISRRGDEPIARIYFDIVFGTVVPRFRNFLVELQKSFIESAKRELWTAARQNTFILGFENAGVVMQNAVDIWHGFRSEKSLRSEARVSGKENPEPVRKIREGVNLTSFEGNQSLPLAAMEPPLERDDLLERHVRIEKSSAPKERPGLSGVDAGAEKVKPLDGDKAQGDRAEMNRAPSTVGMESAGAESFFEIAKRYLYRKLPENSARFLHFVVFIYERDRIPNELMSGILPSLWDMQESRKIGADEYDEMMAGVNHAVGQLQKTPCGSFSAMLEAEDEKAAAQAVAGALAARDGYLKEIDGLADKMAAEIPDALAVSDAISSFRKRTVEFFEELRSRADELGIGTNEAVRKEATPADQNGAVPQRSEARLSVSLGDPASPKPGETLERPGLYEGVLGRLFGRSVIGQEDLRRFTELALTDLDQAISGLREVFGLWMPGAIAAELIGTEQDLAASYQSLERVLTQTKLGRAEFDRLADQRFETDLKVLAAAIQKRETGAIAQVVFYRSEMRDRLFRFIEVAQTAERFNMALVSSNKKELMAFVTELAKRGLSKGVTHHAVDGSEGGWESLARELGHGIFNEKFGVFFPEEAFVKYVPAWQRVVRSQIPPEYGPSVLTKLTPVFSTAATADINAVMLRQAFPDFTNAIQFVQGKGLLIGLAWLEMSAAADRQISASA
jgi:hypothetical protein